LIGAAQLTAVGGCNNEGEGERCTFFNGGDAGENGTDECSVGLVCTANDYYMANSTVLTGAGMLGVCCPPPGTPSTAAACSPNLGGSMMGGRPAGDGSFDAGHDSGKAGDGGKDASTHDATAGDASHSHDGAPGDAHNAAEAGHDGRTAD
jgi:hypothetical protein